MVASTKLTKIIGRLQTKGKFIKVKNSAILLRYSRLLLNQCKATLGYF